MIIESDLAENDALLNAAKLMLVKIGTHSATFRLEGIDGALDALLDCVDHGVNAHATT